MAETASTSSHTPPPTPRPPQKPPASSSSTATARWGRRWATALALGLVCLLLITGIATASILPQLPSLEAVTAYTPRQPLQIFTRDQVEIAQFGTERREYRTLDNIPQRLQDAVITVEDIRFRDHSGVDFRGIASAIVSWLTGGRHRGASTITQQVARNFFLSSRVTFERKFKEIILAWRIERELSKDQILTLYLNQIYLGHHAYGFGAAAKTYFGKPLETLSLAEIAMLAGLPQNPALANPITNLEKATRRQHVVLARLRDTGMITDAEYTQAIDEKLKIRSSLAVEVHAEHVAEMARQAVVDRLGDKAYTQGVKVYTSLVAAEQQTAYSALRKGLMEYERKQAWRGPEDQVDLPEDATDDDPAIAQAFKEFKDDADLRLAIVLKVQGRELTARLATGELVHLSGDSLNWAAAGLSPKAPEALRLARGAVIRVVAAGKGWAISQWPQAQGALVALEPGTGRVRSWVGGFDFTRQPFDHVLQAWRQPGSTFKPFLYSAALEHGIMPATLVNDAPLTLGDWSPENSDGQFDGPLTLKQALARSKNLVSVRLVQHMGVDNTLQWVTKFGFDPARQPNNLTLSLGTGSVTPLQLASGYAVLANGGYTITPRVIERITDAQGQVLYEAPPAPPLTPDTRVVPERNTFLTRTLLQEVTRTGTAARAQAALKRPDLYGKTGTTNDAVDAWFAGFQPSVVAVVWIGYDTPRSLGSRESGGGLALPVWIQYMDRALRGVPVQALAPTDGVVEVDGNWRYAEWAERGMVERLGFGDGQDGLAAPAANAASAAAEEASGVPVIPAPTATPAIGTAAPAASAP